MDGDRDRATATLVGAALSPVGVVREHAVVLSKLSVTACTRGGEFFEHIREIGRHPP
jgi:hypothetical protein